MFPAGRAPLSSDSRSQATATLGHRGSRHDRGRGRRHDVALRQYVPDLELDLHRHRATRAGRPLELTPKEFQLLSLLLRRTGDVLSRTLIAEQVWDINFESDSNVVEVHMRRLRAKVDDPFDCKLIHTVRGVGYVLEQRA